MIWVFPQMVVIGTRLKGSEKSIGWMKILQGFFPFFLHGTRHFFAVAEMSAFLIATSCV